MTLNSAPATLETDRDTFQKLTAFLSANQDKKVVLSSWHNSYGLTLADLSGVLIDPSLVDHDKISGILSNFLRKYETKNPEKYKKPAMNSKTSATTPETIEAASFKVKDLLEDLKGTLETKA